MEHPKEAMRKAVDNAAETLQKEKGEAVKGVSSPIKQTSIKDMVGMSDESIESLYSHAYLLYNTGRYKDAIQVFRLLTLLNALESKYIMGLAACFHMMKEFRTAASSYALVSVIDPENPVPYYHASDCYIQMGDKLSAATMLDLAIKRAQDKPEFAALKKRSEITVEALKRELTQPEKKST